MSDDYKLRVEVEKLHSHGAAWIGILLDDTFRLEICEWDSEIYGDHSTYYDVRVEDKPLLFNALSDHVGKTIVNDEALIATTASAFPGSLQILNWLQRVGIPLKEHWAYV